MFPEPPEFCLGVSKDSVLGRGSAKKLKEGMLQGAAVAIKNGIENLKHFEEIALFGEQIGADRIGDITCNILKSDFITYTQQICSEFDVPMKTFPVVNANWDPDKMRWLPGKIELPINPHATAQAGRPIGVLLTPNSFLRTMPTVDVDDFWSFATSAENEQLRADLNFEIGQVLDKRKLIQLAKRKPDLLRKYIEHLEQSPKPAYDVRNDPKYVVKKYDDAKRIADSFDGGASPNDKTTLAAFVERLVLNYKECVESAKGWTLLWTDQKNRPEPDAQVLFWNSARMACGDRNVDLTPEAETGRGPVDFKVSTGSAPSKKVLIEIKYAKSSSFWMNEENQLITYQRAQGCDVGYFVVVQFSDRDCSEVFVLRATELAKEIGEKAALDFRIVFVDARPKASASKIRAPKT